MGTEWALWEMELVSSWQGTEDTEALRVGVGRTGKKAHITPTFRDPCPVPEGRC